MIRCSILAAIVVALCLGHFSKLTSRKILHEMCSCLDRKNEAGRLVGYRVREFVGIDFIGFREKKSVNIVL